MFKPFLRSSFASKSFVFAFWEEFAMISVLVVNMVIHWQPLGLNETKCHIDGQCQLHFLLSTWQSVCDGQSPVYQFWTSFSSTRDTAVQCTLLQAPPLSWAEEQPTQGTCMDTGVSENSEEEEDDDYCCEAEHASAFEWYSQCNA